MSGTTRRRGKQRCRNDGLQQHQREALQRTLLHPTAGSAQATVKLFEGAAWLALEERYVAATKGLGRSLSEKLTTRTLKREEDPHDFFHDMDRWKTCLEQMGEIVLGYRYEGVLIQALRAEYDYVNNKSYSDRDFHLESIRRTINNIYIDNLSRSSRDGT